MHIHAIEPTRSRGQHRVDGVGRLEFDFHSVNDGRHRGRGLISACRRKPIVCSFVVSQNSASASDSGSQKPTMGLSSTASFSRSAFVSETATPARAAFGATNALAPERARAAMSFCMLVTCVCSTVRRPRRDRRPRGGSWREAALPATSPGRGAASGAVASAARQLPRPLLQIFA